MLKLQGKVKNKKNKSNFPLKFLKKKIKKPSIESIITFNLSDLRITPENSLSQHGIG